MAGLRYGSYILGRPGPSLTRYSFGGATPPQAVTVASLPATGVTSFHRGAGNPPILPEHTFLAYDWALAQGAHILDVDTQLTSDNVLVLHHDLTVDKATDSTGNVSSYTFANFPKIHMADLVGSYYPPQDAHSLIQTLDTYGGRVLLNLEPKDAASVQQMVDLVTARGLKNSVIINSSTPSVVAAATAQGIAGWVYNCNTTAAIDAAAAANPTFIEINTTLTQTLVDYAKSKGVKYVMQGGTANRYEYQRGLGMGVHGCVIDGPGYVYGPVENKANIADEIAQQKVGIGWWRKPRISDGQYAFPVFAADGVKLSQGATTQTSSDATWARRGNYRFGTMCGPKPASYSYRLRIRWDVIPPAGAVASRPGFRFCSLDDRGDGEDALVAPGYVLGLRADGRMPVWKNAANAAGTLLGGTEFQTPAITTPGQVTELRVDITPTAITITRVDTGHTVTYTDATYRGQYHWVQGNTYGYEQTLLTFEWAAA